MVWFRVDDGWHKHRKRIRAGLDMEGMAAQGLWAASGSWASDELTDGFVPDDIVDYLAPGIGQQLAKRLERARLWVRAQRHDEEGWQFWQWEEQQPTAAEVTAALSRKSSGGKLGNHRRWHVGEGKTDPRCPFCRDEGPPGSDRTIDWISDRMSDRGSESDANPTDPTRPDPTRPDVVPSELQKSDGPPSADPATTKRMRATRIPDTFAVDADMVAWARTNTPHVDGRHETAKFIDYWTAKSGKDATKVDWVATWRNWMRKAAEQAGPPNGHHTRTAAGAGVGAIPAGDRCPEHPGQRAGNCGPCRANQLAMPGRRTA